MEHSSSIYHIDVCTIEGKILRLEHYKGKFLLIVNLATQCGFREQLEEIESCYQSLKPHNFEILGFPSDQFNQEPLDNEEIQIYYRERKTVSFPIFQKVYVNGQNAHPLFKHLSLMCPGIFGSRPLKWNFTKFFVDHNGVPIRRFSPITNMVLIEDYIREYIITSQNDKL